MTEEIRDNQPPIWAMDRIGDWIEGGCDPTDPINMDAKTLQRLEVEGLVTIDTGQAKGKKQVAHLTWLGKHEQLRLRHVLSQTLDNQ
jgi:hypothetical protein